MSAESLLEVDDDIVTVGLADDLAEDASDRELVCAVAKGHERATERDAVDGAGDLDQTACAEDSY